MQGAVSHQDGGVACRGEYGLVVKDLRTDCVNKRMNGYCGVTGTGKRPKFQRKQQNQKEVQEWGKNLILQIWD